MRGSLPNFPGGSLPGRRPGPGRSARLSAAGFPGRESFKFISSIISIFSNRAEPCFQSHSHRTAARLLVLDFLPRPVPRRPPPPGHPRAAFSGSVSNPCIDRRSGSAAVAAQSLGPNSRHVAREPCSGSLILWQSIVSLRARCSPAPEPDSGKGRANMAPESSRTPSTRHTRLGASAVVQSSNQGKIQKKIGFCSTSRDLF